MNSTLIIACLFSIFVLVYSFPTQASQKAMYLEKRSKIIWEDKKQGVAASWFLNENEREVDEILLSAKKAEIDRSRHSNVPFPASVHFFKSKPLIQQSEVFNIIKKMPKGGALHLHDIGLVDVEWLVKNVTYKPNLYICTRRDGQLLFQFFRYPPYNSECPWRLVQDERRNYDNVTDFDDMLYKNMTLMVDSPEETYTTLDSIWTAFEKSFMTAGGLIHYAPVFSEYFYQALTEMRDDNIQYVEVRAQLTGVYNLDGNVLDRIAVMQMYKDVFEQFRADNPRFSGGKIIFSGMRFSDELGILSDVHMAVDLYKKFPDHFAGYDLVGQEDIGKPLLSYLDALLYPSTLNPPIQLPYFFHAGETNWQGLATDMNLVDALLLNTTRIGHGFAITKHPGILKSVRQHNIAIEVNPISNQVLKLVSDLRNHPATFLLADGYPVVISSDDPPLWGSSGLSYDYYAAFMAMTGYDDGIRVLKEFAVNSILYSSMSDIEKSAALDTWDEEWKVFLQAIRDSKKD